MGDSVSTNPVQVHTIGTDGCHDKIINTYIVQEYEESFQFVGSRCPWLSKILLVRGDVILCVAIEENAIEIIFINKVKTGDQHFEV
jgi:hypothetical protein